MNGADRLCETLLAGGIDVCFANPGTSEMHFVAALDRQPRMRCLLGLFEGVVTGAADGYARMAERPAATLLHLGPGLANGLANLHNARRAGSPIVNIVGDHATYHLKYDAPLTSDIEALARPMSHWVKTAGDAGEVSRDAAAAIAAANTPPGQIATLILPADVAWGEIQAHPPAVAPAAILAPVEAEAVGRAAAMLRSGVPTLILLAGTALRAKPLETASRIARAKGARLLAQQSNARVERGAGRVAIDRVQYKVDLALADLKDIRQLILVGAKAPVAFFAYPGKPSRVTPEDCEIMELSPPGGDLAHALNWLADELGVANSAQPLLQQRVRPELPRGGLTIDAIAVAIGALLPEHAIVCDESVTSGRNFFRFTHGAAPHDFLQLTGGAIGEGLPMALGAAVACPGRKVICLQADGSGMYTNQALWTYARIARHRHRDLRQPLLCDPARRTSECRSGCRGSERAPHARS